VTLSQFLKLAIKMLAKVVIFSCFVAASLAAPTADADADAQILLAAAPAVVAPAVVAPAVVAPVAPVVAAPLPVAVAPNCVIEYDELTTQVCTPRTETVCETKEVIAQSVEYKKLCTEVTSKHCANGIPGYAHVVAKREADAEADAQFWGGYGHHFAAPVAYAAHEETHTSPCHEVVAEHCLSNPEVVDTPVPIEQCHVVNKVDCVDHVEKIPKTVCTPVESKIVRHVAHPFGYAYGK
jgi:hypothetical protein